MKFEIETTSWNFGDDPEKILEKYPMLKDFGFEIKEIEYTSERRIRDENNNYIIQRITNTKDIALIQLADLSELLALRKAVDQELIITSPDIIHFRPVHNTYPVIEIYDTWRE